MLAGTASIVVIYLLVRRLSSSRAGLIAAGLLALSGFQIMYSRLLLTEPFYVLFLLLSLLCSVEYLRARALGWLIASAIFASCLQLTKYNGALVAVPVLSVLTWESVTLRGKERSLAFQHAVLLSSIIGGVIASNLALYARLGLLPTFINRLAGYVGVAQVSPLGLLQYLEFVTTRPVLYLSVAGMAYGLLRRRSVAWATIHLGLILYVAFLFTYTFYLRLLAPIAVFLIIYSALFVDALAGMRTRAGYVAVLIAALQFGYETRLHFTRFITHEFGGYAKASALLNGLGASVPIFMLSQHNLWPSLSRQVWFLPNEPVDKLPIPDHARHVYLVTDLYAYYKYGQRQYTGRLASLDDCVVVQVPNPLPFEAVENQLTLSELARLETDNAFREQLLSIRVFRLTPAEARAALTAAGAGPVH